MRILHTADWHLGDRLGRIDRTADLRRAVERIAAYCAEHAVEVLLVAGDMFSEMARPDSLRASIEHLQQTFQPFLLTGGTILALTGNHDNENFCQTLRLVMTLAAPADDGSPLAPRADPTRGASRLQLHSPGRLYLATSPTLLRLQGKQGEEVQFILMPYPTPSRYLREEEVQRYASVEEKNRHVQTAYARQLREMQEHPAFDRDKPTVLSAHVHVQGSTLPKLFRITEEESVIFAESDLPTQFAYVALGHIHQHQCLRGLAHVRYCGSIERLDFGEQGDSKGVVLLDVGSDGLAGEPRFLPLDATPIYEVTLETPLAEALERERQRETDASRDLVRIVIRYTAGQDNLEDTLRQLDTIFSRWYAREWSEASALDGTLVIGGANPSKSFEDTVRDYLRQELLNHPDEHRDAILRRAEELMSEMSR
jgi:exonuclease SbcD